MKKIEFGQTLAVIANVGIIASIVFLAIELRQTTNAIVGASYQARALSMHDRSMFLSDTEFLTPALVQYSDSDWEELSAEQQLRIRSASGAAFYRIDATFYLYELGLLSEDYYRTVFSAELRLWVPRWRENGVLEQMYDWGYVRPTFDEEIQEYLDDPLRLD